MVIFRIGEIEMKVQNTFHVTYARPTSADDLNRWEITISEQSGIVICSYLGPIRPMYSTEMHQAIGKAIVDAMQRQGGK